MTLLLIGNNKNSKGVDKFMIDVISLVLSKKYTDKEIIKAATSLKFKQKIVDSLPSSGEIHTIYFVKNNSS